MLFYWRFCGEIPVRRPMLYPIELAVRNACNC